MGSSALQGLVHQDDIRLDGEGAGDAKPLLLAAGQREAALVELVLHVIPQRGGAQRRFDDVRQIALDTVHLGTEGDVLKDRLGERVWLLEHHPYAAPHLDDIDVPGVQVLAAVFDGAVDVKCADEVVHAVHAAQQRGLAATRRTDEGRNLALRDAKRDVIERAELTVVRAQALDLDHGRARRLLDTFVWRQWLLGTQWVLRLPIVAVVDYHLTFLWYRLRRTMATEFIASSTTSRTTMPAAAVAWKSCWGRAAHA